MENARFHSLFLCLLVLTLAGCADTGNQPKQKNPHVVKAYGDQLKADAFFHNGEPDSAFAYYNKAKSGYEKGQDSFRVAYSLLKIGELYNRYNDYQELQATDVEALKFLETSDDTLFRPTLYTQIGISFAMTREVDSATFYYDKGRSYVRQDWKMATIDNNIGYANIVSGNFNKAYQILDKTMRSYTLHDTLPIKAKIFDNFGYSAFKSGKPGGKAFVSKALELRKALADTSGLIANYLHLAEMSQDKAESFQLASTAERLAFLHNSPEDRLEALRFLLSNANLAQIPAFSEKYIAISDSLEMVRVKARSAFAKIKYDVRREQVKTLEKEIERSREYSQKLNWIIAFIVFVVVSGIAVYYLIKRSKNIRKKATYEAEVRISTKLHDELANEVHKTIVFTETKNLSDDANKETLLQRLEAIYDGTRSISRDNSEIPKGYFSQTLRDLLQEYNSDECAVIAQGIANVNWDKLERHRQLEFYRIVQELLANMRKHSQCSHALFLFAMEGKNISLTYSDNGSGSAKTGQTRKNGLRIMENRISGLKGSATFESMPGNGFRAHVQFPL